MSDVSEQVVVTRNEDEHRWEARIGGELAGFAAYQLTDELVVFTHTEVDPAFEGKGVGGRARAVRRSTRWPRRAPAR